MSGPELSLAERVIEAYGGESSGLVIALPVQAHDHDPEPTEPGEAVAMAA